ncbi:MAG TPA: response regulator transcription factor [Anaerolineae bacterium]|nr:response regulator transcription factor [Anaerolineae bacterium]HQI83784.1 response regulator transcription factor [Anaerolineae bacterium]
MLPSSASSADIHPLVLVVDDEPRIIRFVRINLEMEGFRVVEASNGLQAVDQVREKMPDAVLLDVSMPEMDGFETLRMIRELSNVPVVMLTVRSSEEDKVQGLDLGADDYITKPFSPRELVSRLRAVLRRVQATTPVASSQLTIDDYLGVDFNTGEVIVKGERVKLRPTEFRLLRHLIENAGWTVPYSTLLSKVWGYEYKDAIAYLRLYINYLRKKIEPDLENPRYIFTERGMGYRFVDFRRQPTDK